MRQDHANGNLIQRKDLPRDRLLTGAMNSACAHIPRFFLMLCIAWHSGFTTAWASDIPGTLAMEICATGMVEAVRVDTAGTSDVPPRDCCACTGCCLVVGIVPTVPSATCSARSYTSQRQPASAYSIRALRSDFGSLPRAPPAPAPAPRSSMKANHDMIASDHISTSQFTHGKGRFLQKDPSP